MAENSHNHSKINHIIFFDGECGVCDRFVQIMIKHGPETMRFCRLQSPYFRKMCPELSSHLDSVVYLRGSRARTHSDAALYALWDSGGWLRLGAGLGFMVPRFLRDQIYRLIAQNRYRIMPQACLLPDARTRQRFID